MWRCLDSPDGGRSQELCQAGARARHGEGRPHKMEWQRDLKVMTEGRWQLTDSPEAKQLREAVVQRKRK